MLIQRQLLTLMRIRIRLLFYADILQIRILFLIKVTQTYDHGSTDVPRLHVQPIRLHCERLRPSMAPLWLVSLHSSWILTLMRIRIHRIRNTDFRVTVVCHCLCLLCLQNKKKIMIQFSIDQHWKLTKVTLAKQRRPSEFYSIVLTLVVTRILKALSLVWPSGATHLKVARSEIRK